MIYVDIDVERLIHEVSVSGDATANAKQLAGAMIADEKLAQVVAMAIPWYAHLAEDISSVTSMKRVELAEEEYHDYLIQSAEML